MSRKPKAKKEQSQNSVAFTEAVDHQSGLSQRLKDTPGADPGSAAISNTVQGMELPFLRHRRAAPCESSKRRIHSPGSAARSCAGAQRCGRAPPQRGLEPLVQPRDKPPARCLREGNLPLEPPSAFSVVVPPASQHVHGAWQQTWEEKLSSSLHLFPHRLPQLFAPWRPH